MHVLEVRQSKFGKPARGIAAMGFALLGPMPVLADGAASMSMQSKE